MQGPGEEKMGAGRCREIGEIIFMGEWSCM